MATLSSLTPSVRARLDELTQSLISLAGENLVGLVVHGSAARPTGWNERTSDVDLVCVLKKDDFALLSAIGPSLELARTSARIETMILTESEIGRAADCFPLLYADIARTSATIHGVNPFSSLRIEGEHKRLRIEQELREARIRMRRIATDLANTVSFAGALERKLKQLRAPLWALLDFKGTPPKDELPETVVSAACAVYGCDLQAIKSLREAPERAFGEIAKLVDGALHDIDSAAKGVGA